jgi:hypothetical protein
MASVLALSWASFVGATVYYDYADVDNGNMLPIAPPGELTEAQSISDALAMPGVQLAADSLSALGFVRQPSWDHGWAGQDSTLVALGFADPGDPNQGAMILIRCRVVNGHVRTWINAGSFGWDPATSAAVAAENGDCLTVGIGDMSTTDLESYSRTRAPALMFLDLAVCTAGLCGTAAQFCGATGPGVVLCSVIACHVVVFYCAFDKLQ